MDRAEAAGLGVATLGHLALLAALSVGFGATRLPVPKSDPIEVSFVDEVGLESRAPTLAAEPAPLAGPADEAPQPAMPAPPEIQPVPAPPAQSQSAPAPSRAQPRPAPPKAASAAAAPATPRRTASGLSSVVAGLSEKANSSRSTTPPAAAAGPAVQASLGAEVRRQLKPHWKAPTGADAELLRTEVVIALAENGQVEDIRIVGTSGQTASNRPQVRLHQEQAARAVRLAAPFRLPAQYYEAWKSLRVTFDKRLSQ